MGRRKKLADGETLSARIERTTKECVEYLAAKAAVEPSDVVREAIDAIVEANPIDPIDFDAWRKRRAKQEKGGGVPGLRRPTAVLQGLTSPAVPQKKKGAGPRTATPRKKKRWRREWDGAPAQQSLIPPEPRHDPNRRTRASPPPPEMQVAAA